MSREAVGAQFDPDSDLYQRWEEYAEGWESKSSALRQLMRRGLDEIEFEQGGTDDTPGDRLRRLYPHFGTVVLLLAVVLYAEASAALEYVGLLGLIGVGLYAQYLSPMDPTVIPYPNREPAWRGIKWALRLELWGFRLFVPAAAVLSVIGGVGAEATLAVLGPRLSAFLATLLLACLYALPVGMIATAVTTLLVELGAVDGSPERIRRTP